jgi:ABC-type lipoprotein export system ATPase subunit
MSHRAAHHPTHLSGGEQQRVAIARALVIHPAIVLADEPTGNLDRAGGRAVMYLVQEINEQTGVTLLLVTHTPSSPRTLAECCGSSTARCSRRWSCPTSANPRDENLLLAR